MARKYTRKQLNQPDEFITMTQRAWGWLTDHTTRVLAMIGVTTVIVAAAWTWEHLSLRRAEASTSVLSKALEVNEAAVLPTASAQGAEEAGATPRFATESARLSAADQAFDRAIAEGRGAQLRALAVLMRAGVRYQRGRYQAAQADYEAFLRDADEDTTRLFGAAATEGLMYSFEARQQWSQALAAARRLPHEGDARFDALYHEGRILLSKGDRKGGQERLQQVMAGAKSRTLIERASQALMALRDAP